jgi:hypothetical protein
MKKVEVKIQFDIGDIVFLRTDPEQNERMITRFMVSKPSIEYEVVCGTEVSLHYGFELSKEKIVK